jgi:2-oxoisovalerate dehydrogenase E2 component (dihydrolipoyl transacylase)
MMASLNMPNVGEGVTEGTVTRWLKAEGDAVALDEPVVEVETDKAVVEIPSPYEGRLARILVREGEVVAIGVALAEFETAAGPEQGDARPRQEAPAPAGVAQQPALARDSRAHVRRTHGREERRRRYSPVVLKLAAEHDIDLALVRGTGIEGRVTRQDVARYLENPVAHSAPPAAGSGVVGARPAEAAEEQAPREAARPPSADRSETVPLSATRRTIAQRMSEAHRTIPVAWMAVEADVTGLVALREQLRESFERQEGVKLTYMPFFVEAIVAALKEHPALNATFADDGVTVHRRYDIGIAVAAEWGLVVPVVRDAGDRSIAGLAREIQRLGERARERKLSLDELRGATFTIDNTGAFGSVISQPIVPPGQAAIITTEAVRRELRVRPDGSFAARSVMHLALSFDHRALDGAQAGAFMQDVRARLERYAPDAASSLRPSGRRADRR